MQDTYQKNTLEAEATLDIEMLHRYTIIHQEFMHHGDTQTSELILRRFLQSPQIPTSHRAEPLLRQLIGTMQDFAFNEIETALWVLILKKIHWIDSTLPLHYVIFHSAFAAKSFLNNDDDMKPYEAFLGQKIKNFKKNFLNFQQTYKRQLEVEPYQINAILRELGASLSNSRSKPITDYNYYVDEILSLSPPYSVTQESMGLSKLVKIEGEFKELKSRKSKAPKKIEGLKDTMINIKNEDIVNNEITEIDTERLKTAASFENSGLLSRIDSLCFKYENTKFTPICSPVVFNKTTSLLNRLASA